MPPEADDVLATCGPKPNCVSSRSADSRHRVDPLAYTGSVADAQGRLKHALATLPRTTVVAERPGYLHAECRSLVFGFVDDLELVLAEGRIDLRSAARTGTYDFGVNRRRVARLRAAFIAAGA